MFVPSGTGRSFTGDAPGRLLTPFSAGFAAGGRTGSCIYFTPVPKGDQSVAYRIYDDPYVVEFIRYL